MPGILVVVPVAVADEEDDDMGSNTMRTFSFVR